MRRFLIAALLIASLAWGKDHSGDYQPAKLVDLQASATGAGALRAQYSFCLAIRSKSELLIDTLLQDWEKAGRSQG